MSEISKIEAQGSRGVSAVEAGMARRRLIRAGLAAAPVMLGLTSQSALAGNGSTNPGVICKPSMWASMKAASTCLSHAGGNPTGTCKKYSDWANNSTVACKTHKYHPVTNPTASYHQLNTCYGTRTVVDVCSLPSLSVPSGSGLSLAKHKLGQHCAGMYINLQQGLPCPVSLADCQRIWQSCLTTDSCTPVVGATYTWTTDECNGYFDYICGIKTLPQCV
jgi:hypothetical protein